MNKRIERIKIRLEELGREKRNLLHVLENIESDSGYHSNDENEVYDSEKNVEEDLRMIKKITRKISTLVLKGKGEKALRYFNSVNWINIVEYNEDVDIIRACIEAKNLVLLKLILKSCPWNRDAILEEWFETDEEKRLYNKFK